MISSSPPKNKSRAVALVLTLGAVVLLTVLVLAFFSQAQLNRRISQSSISLLRTEHLAASALDILVSEIRQEIIDPAHSTADIANGSTVYLPKPGFSLPQKAGVVSATGPIVKVSADGVAIRPGSSIVGSSVAISSRSLNAHSISHARWFTSSSASPRLGEQGAVPTWLFATRSNGIKTPEIAKARDSAHGDYVIGRFAYTIYDIGQLPNANVAGYTQANASAAAFKPSPVYSDLQQAGATPLQIAELCGWRNAKTGSNSSLFQRWAAGSASNDADAGAAQAAFMSGHLAAALGDNGFLNRRDLLNHPDCGAVAGALTHFSVSLNAPAALPSTYTATAANANPVTVRWPADVTGAVHYRDDGIQEPIAFAQGDSVVPRRFSLAKLSWLGPAGPSSTAFHASLTDAQKTQAIRDCFGLAWDPDRALWEYTAADNNYAIRTLPEAAAAGRQPNFFEILKAGISQGSLGKAAQNKTYAHSDQKTREGVSDLQILRIGANIVDCADADNYPTTIAQNIGGIDVPVHGVEDLPYLYGIDLARISDVTLVDPNHQIMEWCYLVLAPTLFNPHRGSVPSGGKPSKIRVRVASGDLDAVYFSAEGNTAGKPLARTNLNIDLSSSCLPIEIPDSSFEVFRTALNPVRDNEATSPTRLGTLSPGINANDSKVHGFLYYQYTGLPEQFSYGSSNGGQIRGVSDNLLIVLEFQDAAGDWRIYDTFTGNEAFTASGTGIGGDHLLFGTGLAKSVARDCFQLSFAFLKFDPRTTRFGGSQSDNFPSSVKAPLDPGGANPTPQGVRSGLPFGAGAIAQFGVYPAAWAEGNKTSWSDDDGRTISNVADPDGVTRPADAWLNGASANLFRSLTDSARRPVLLQRPFRSVGELGYVFRDSPWKTLSFFDPTSGDAALLDFFSVADEAPVTAGRIHLNTPNDGARRSLLSGTARASDGSNPMATVDAIAEAYDTYAYDGETPSSAMPGSIGDLVSFMTSTELNDAYPGSSNPIKTQREAIVRSFAETTQSRTWNLLIDIIAQTGRYPRAADSLDKFLVEGQRRYWLSVAIDRYTGKVIKRSLETVDE